MDELNKEIIDTNQKMDNMTEEEVATLMEDDHINGDGAQNGAAGALGTGCGVSNC